MTENSLADLAKHGSDMFLQPDDWFSINFSSSGSGNGDGYANNFLSPTTNFDNTLGQTQEPKAFNASFASRLTSAVGMTVDREVKIRLVGHR